MLPMSTDGIGFVLNEEAFRNRVRVNVAALTSHFLSQCSVEASSSCGPLLVSLLINNQVLSWGTSRSIDTHRQAERIQDRRQSLKDSSPAVCCVPLSRVKNADGVQGCELTGSRVDRARLLCVSCVTDDPLAVFQLNSTSLLPSALVPASSSDPILCSVTE
jgi:hypothetical protein